jgi:hypothetical protein
MVTRDPSNMEETAPLGKKDSPSLLLSLSPSLQSYKRTTGSADITDWLLLT